MTEAPRLRGLPPLVSGAPAVLVLGSFPSVASLEKGEYYAFARNQFWRLVAEVFGEVPPGTREGRADLVGRRGIAVWDVIGECRREGSLDAAIRDARANDLSGFLAEHPSIRRVVLNGAAAAAAFARFFPRLAAGDGPSGRLEIVRAPSTSPVPSRAYRRREDKLPAWRSALAERQAGTGPIRA